MQYINVSQFYQTLLCIALPLLLIQRLLLYCTQLTGKYEDFRIKYYEAQFQFTNEYFVSPEEEAQREQEKKIKEEEKQRKKEQQRLKKEREMQKKLEDESMAQNQNKSQGRRDSMASNKQTIRNSVYANQDNAQKDSNMRQSMKKLENLETDKQFKQNTRRSTIKQKTDEQDASKAQKQQIVSDQEQEKEVQNKNSEENQEQEQKQRSRNNSQVSQKSQKSQKSQVSKKSQKSQKSKKSTTKDPAFILPQEQAPAEKSLDKKQSIAQIQIQKQEELQENTGQSNNQNRQTAVEGRKQTELDRNNLAIGNEEKKQQQNQNQKPKQQIQIDPAQLQQMELTAKRRLKYCRRIDEAFNVFVPVIYSVIVLGILTHSVYIFSMCCFFGFAFTSLLFNYGQLLDRLEGATKQSYFGKINKLVSSFFIFALFISYWIDGQF